MQLYTHLAYMKTTSWTLLHTKQHFKIKNYSYSYIQNLSNSCENNPATCTIYHVASFFVIEMSSLLAIQFCSDKEHPQVFHLQRCWSVDTKSWDQNWTLFILIMLEKSRMGVPESICMWFRPNSTALWRDSNPLSYHVKVSTGTVHWHVDGNAIPIVSDSGTDWFRGFTQYHTGKFNWKFNASRNWSRNSTGCRSNCKLIWLSKPLPGVDNPSHYVHLAINLGSYNYAFMVIMWLLYCCS